MESALASLSAIDPEAFDIALTAAAHRAGRVPETTAEIPEDEEPIPVCRHCRAPVGIFLAHGLRWQHFRGDDATSATQQIHHPGHPGQVTRLLPGEDPEQL